MLSMYICNESNITLESPMPKKFCNMPLLLSLCVGHSKEEWKNRSNNPASLPNSGLLEFPTQNILSGCSLKRYTFFGLKGKKIHTVLKGETNICRTQKSYFHVKKEDFHCSFSVQLDKAMAVNCHVISLAEQWCKVVQWLAHHRQSVIQL